MRSSFFALAVGALLLTTATALAAPRVAVQPIEGQAGPAIRRQVARLLSRRCRPVTSLRAVTGTAQYLTLAKERSIAAFVSTELEETPQRHRVTFLVWNGLDGGVLARWTVAARPKKLPREIARGFWKQLGPALQSAKAPPSERPGRGPTLRIDAGSPLDDDVQAKAWRRGRAPRD